ALLKAATPAIIAAVMVSAVALGLGVRDAMPLGVVFGAAFALAANVVVTLRGFRAGWKHGVAYLGHTGVAVLLIGIISSSNYGRSAQVQLPVGQEKDALGYRLKFEGVRSGARGQDRAVIAVSAP